MKETIKILVVDDEENIRWLFQKALQKKGYQVYTAASALEALDKIRSCDYLLVFTDIFMEGMSGLELLGQAKELKPQLKMVVMTAQDTMNNTIEAMRKGAHDYITKPFDFDEIYALINKALASLKVEGLPASDEGLVADDVSMDAIIGKNKKMQDIFKTIGKSAASDLAILITGESGTGKEMVARALHSYSQRGDQPLICINCAAISRELLESELFGHEKGAFTGAVESKQGKFELADGGTLFLDEIGDMEMALQAKILRVLQDQQFYRVGGKAPIHSNVRIIAATNQNLKSLMANNQFREDLFHRLNVISIHMPPLRERPDDILLLARHFLKKFGGRRGRATLAPDVERVFKAYPWRGNIRELENVIKRALVLAPSGAIFPEHLPSYFQDNKEPDPWDKRLGLLIQDYLEQNDWEKEGDLYDNLVQAMEKHLLENLLKRTSGKQVPVAKALGINRNTLKRKIDALNIQIKKKGDGN